MKFLRNLFGKASRGDSRVGPLLYALYERVDHNHKPALKKFLSQAPSGCEIVATFPSFIPNELAQTIVSSVQQILGQLAPRGSAVVGGEMFPDGFILYVKGDIPLLAKSTLEVKLKEFPFGDKPVEVFSEYVSSDKLKELP